MAIDYARIRTQTAERLIRENGKVAYVVVPGAPFGDPWNPQPGEPTEEAVYFVETGYKIDDRNQTLIQQGDKLGIVSTETGVVPEKDRAIKIDGTTYQMIDVQPLNPGGTVMLYEIHARR